MYYLIEFGVGRDGAMAYLRSRKDIEVVEMTNGTAQVWPIRDGVGITSLFQPGIALIKRIDDTKPDEEAC